MADMAFSSLLFSVPSHLLCTYLLYFVIFSIVLLCVYRKVYFVDGLCYRMPPVTRLFDSVALIYTGQELEMRYTL
jgi:type II secretory pathway component PulF